MIAEEPEQAPAVEMLAEEAVVVPVTAAEVAAEEIEVPEAEDTHAGEGNEQAIDDMVESIMRAVEAATSVEEETAAEPEEPDEEKIPVAALVEETPVVKTKETATKGKRQDWRETIKSFLGRNNKA